MRPRLKTKEQFLPCEGVGHLALGVWTTLLGVSRPSFIGVLVGVDLTRSLVGRTLVWWIPLFRLNRPNWSSCSRKNPQPSLFFQIAQDN